MEETDLMIGNFIEFDEQQCEVIEIGDPTCWVYSKMGQHYEARYDQLGGIELTETLLFRLGFVQPQPDKNFFIHASNLHSFNSDTSAILRFVFIEGDSKLTVSFGDSKLGCLFARLNYLHELQNLWYWANFKETLKIDL